jgi:hypothetical protein
LIAREPTQRDFTDRIGRAAVAFGQRHAEKITRQREGDDVSAPIWQQLVKTDDALRDAKGGISPLAFLEDCPSRTEQNFRREQREATKLKCIGGVPQE